MDSVTYALLKKAKAQMQQQISGMMPSYKGTVATVADLPSNATEGDMYVVASEGNIHYYYDGVTWSAIDPDIATIAEIDGLYT